MTQSELDELKRLQDAVSVMLAALQTIAFDENCEMLQAIKLAKETLAKVNAP